MMSFSTLLHALARALARQQTLVWQGFESFRTLYTSSRGFFIEKNKNLYSKKACKACESSQHIEYTTVN